MQKLGDFIKKTLLSQPLLKSYELTNCKAVSLYEYTFVSSKYDRWFFVRLSYRGRQVSITLWLNKLGEGKSSNFDVEGFCKENGLTTILPKFSFAVGSLEELEIKINRLFISFEDKSAEKIKAVFNGSLWIDSPFDWHGYK